MLHAVILAGGSGTRFWPLSRRGLPKQFLPIVGNQSLLRQTIARVAQEVPPQRTWVVTSDELVGRTQEELPELPPAQILIEPAPRGTAAAIGLAAARLLAEDPDATMLVMPSDHWIDPPGELLRTIEIGVSLLQTAPQSLVLFGISPTFPALGYGYIERESEKLQDVREASRVVSFREKPDRATAEDFLKTERFVWNSGIFLWRAERILHWLRQLLPATADAVTQIVGHMKPSAESHATSHAKSLYLSLPNESIDRAILERADHLLVVSASFRWDDLGTWSALERHIAPNNKGNITQGSVVTIDAKGCVVQTTTDHLVATAGLDDVLIVHTPWATLVTRKGDDDGLRRLVRQIEEEGYEQFL